MLTDRDHESVLRMMRVEEIPDDVEKLVSGCTDMYHRGGGNGPLGPAMLAVLLCSGKVAMPADKNEPPPPVVWRNVKPGTEVDCLLKGEWRPGVFREVVTPGYLGCVLTNETAIREFAALECRLSTGEAVPVPPPPPPLEPEPVQSLPEPVEIKEVQAENILIPIEKFPWRKIRVDEPVVVEVDGDILDAWFLGLVNDTLTVKLGDGSEREVPTDKAMYAGRRKISL